VAIKITAPQYKAGGNGIFKKLQFRFSEKLVTLPCKKMYHFLTNLQQNKAAIKNLPLCPA
jgi:hypothetical protein